MSAWSRWSFRLLALLSSTVNFSTTAYPVFNWDYRFIFFPASASCHEVLLYFPSSCLVVCPYALLLLPLKKAQTNCVVVLVPDQEAKIASINFHFTFSFSFVSLTFISLPRSFFTCVVRYFSFSNVSHDRNEKCVSWARPQLKTAVQILPKPLNIQEQSKTITRLSPPPPICSMPLAGKLGGWHVKSTHGHGVTFGQLLAVC